MKAIVFTEYGPPSNVLKLEEVEKPIPSDDEVLVKVYASSVNYCDPTFVSGKPFLGRLYTGGLFKPKNTTPGADIAGQVEAVGVNVEQFQPGDKVYGDLSACGFGGFSEYVSVPENALALNPANMTYEEAASVPQAAVVALQGLRDKGQIQSGQRVLINGASGGVGTFAVQIAKSYGAEVTGVCSTRKLDMVRSIMADHVIDYTQEDFTQSEQRYDLIIDIVANRSISEYTRALSSKGNYVAIAFNSVSLFLGSLISKTDGKQVSSLAHKPNDKDLVFMKDLIESGKVIPVIDKYYPLNEVAEAVRYYGEGNPSGKVVISVDHNNK